MAAAYPARRVAVFEELRRRLFGIAYRMIGITADAEDIVQEAYLRWHQADTEEIRSAEAWLVSVEDREGRNTESLPGVAARYVLDSQGSNQCGFA